MDTQKASPSEDKVVDFMLEEYATLREMRLSLDSLGESRVNFFLATISGAIVGLALINQLASYVEIIFFINGAIFVGLLLFGLVTFARMVERTVKNTSYSRGMNRIRRYFVEKHPEIEPYLWLPTSDDKPSFGYAVYNFKTKRLGLTGLAPMVAIINSIIATVGIVILMTIVLATPIFLTLLIGTIAFILVAATHYRYLVKRMKKMKEVIEVRFPSPKRG